MKKIIIKSADAIKKEKEERIDMRSCPETNCPGIGIGGAHIKKLFNVIPLPWSKYSLYSCPICGCIWKVEY